MPDKIIFTALFGNYEDLKEPTVITPGWTYMCYTDQDIKSDNWKIIETRIEGESSPQRQARIIKILGQTGKSIWIDASFQINCNLDQWWNKYFKAPITAINHPVRKCAYREADICINRGLDAENVKRQIEGYRNEGLPRNNGLISSGILMRDGSNEAEEFCDLWCDQIINGSLRDQIGFAYCAWKMPIVNYINYDYRTGTDFIYQKHYHNR